MPKGVYQRKPGMRRNVAVKPVQDRFNAKVEVLENGCWRWIGFIDKAGYGRLNAGRRGSPILYAHVYSFEQKHGPIADGKELDHTCRNRWCCNPDHVEPVTHMVNVMRGESPTVVLHRSGKCKRGHEMTPDNTARHKRGSVAYCKTCRKDRRNGKI